MKENKAISKIFDILEWIVTAGLLLLIILVGVQKFSEAGNFFGYRIYIVASGSMIPAYNIGDTLLVKEVPMEEFEIGDAITYKGETGGVDGIVITHEVRKIEKDEKGKYLFHTKGIANNIEDPMVYEKQVLGKVTHKFLILSILGRIITNRLLLLLGIMLPMAFLVAVEIIKIVYKKDDDEFDKLLDVENEEDSEEKEKPKKKEKVEIKIEEKTGKELEEIPEEIEDKKENLVAAVEEEKNDERALIEELIKEVKKVKKTNEKLKGKLYGKPSNKSYSKQNGKTNNKKNNNQGASAKNKNYYKNNKNSKKK